MRWIFSLVVLIGTLSVQPVFAADVLEALASANKKAAMHNAEGIKAYNEGEWKSAEHHFIEAVQIDGEFAEAHFNLAMSLHKMGRHSEAGMHFRHAKRYGSGNPAITGSKVLQQHAE